MALAFGAILLTSFVTTASSATVENTANIAKNDIYGQMRSKIELSRSLIESAQLKKSAVPEETRAFTNISTDNIKIITVEQEKMYMNENKITLAHHEYASQVTKSKNEYFAEAKKIERSTETTPVMDKNRLNPGNGVYKGPSGKETYYNLTMGGVIYLMRYAGYSEEEYPYWIREDGVKMFGKYVMVAADLSVRPKGTIVESSVGTAIVVDTGHLQPTQLDIAVNW